MLVLETERLLLRTWEERDKEPFAQINASAEVMRYFPKCLSREESDQMVDRLSRAFDKNGFCFYAAELKSSGAFAGFIGLSRPNFEAPFTPCVEIGWRLGEEHWRKGLASEGAKGVLNYGFVKLGLSEIVSFTAMSNIPSRKVMEKIGMVRDQNGDFEHQRVEAGHPLSWHVLYRITAGEWRAIQT